MKLTVYICIEFWFKNDFKDRFFTFSYKKKKSQFIYMFRPNMEFAQS
jgi:hypothetical protein